jgi:Flp pilus assembly protein TadD
MTEAVTYVSGRSELLCTAFFLTSWLAFRAVMRGRPRWLAPGIACFILGLGAKENAAMLPFVLIAYDLLVLGGEPGARRRRMLRLHLPFAGLVAVAGAVRVAVFLGVERGPEAVGLWHNALTEVGVVWRYLALLAAPVGQSIMHPVETVTSASDPRFVAAAVGLAAAAGGLWTLRRRVPVVVFGLVWFLLLLAPAHLIPLQEAMAEHRVYTAGCGVFLAIGGGLVTAIANRGTRAMRAAAASLAVVLAVLGSATVMRNRVWADPVTLWSDAASKAPSTWGVHYALGDALRNAGRCDEAVAAYGRAIEILPGQLPAHLNRGICLAELGRFAEAEAAFKAAAAVDPTSARVHNNLGTLAARQGRLEQARGHFEEAMRLEPRNTRARILLAQMAESVLADPGLALALCEEAAAIDPRIPGVADCIARNRARVAAAEH